MDLFKHLHVSIKYDLEANGAPSSTRGNVRGAGTTVLVSPYIMHRSDATWDRPLSFEPERWREVQGRDGGGAVRAALAGMGHRGCYVPFGAGPRNCIGTGALCPPLPPLPSPPRPSFIIVPSPLVRHVTCVQSITSVAVLVDFASTIFFACTTCIGSEHSAAACAG